MEREAADHIDIVRAQQVLSIEHLQPRYRGVCLAAAALDNAVALIVVWSAGFEVDIIHRMLPASVALSVASAACRLFEVRRNPAVDLPRVLVEPTLAFHTCQMMALVVVGGFLEDPTKEHEGGPYSRLLGVAFLGVLCIDILIVFAAQRKGQAIRRQIEELIEAARAHLPEVERFRCTGDAAADGIEADALCSICLAELAPEEELGRLACKHTFHAVCLERWLESGRADPSAGQRASAAPPGCPFRCHLPGRQNKPPEDAAGEQEEVEENNDEEGPPQASRSVPASTVVGARSSALDHNSDRSRSRSGGSRGPGAVRAAGLSSSFRVQAGSGGSQAQPTSVVVLLERGHSSAYFTSSAAVADRPAQTFPRRAGSHDDPDFIAATTAASIMV
mmetsp:Transcript_22624/g.52770  ORF Transcript_22624/g.52770 Transcript_22624/m.52770 type:complete len:391 (+) Transcript_22624:93-1265(+)